MNEQTMNTQADAAPAGLSFNLGGSSAFQSLQRRLATREASVAETAIDPAALSAAARAAYDLQALGFAAASIPVREFGGQPVELELVVKADRAGTKGYWTGAEYFFAEAVKHAARESMQGYEFFDMTQAKNVSAPGDEAVEAKLRALEAHFDEAHPERTIVVFVKEGAQQKVMSFASFLATIEREVATSVQAVAERGKKNVKHPALDVKHKRLAHFAAAFSNAYERYSMKALQIAGNWKARTAANVTKFTPTEVVVDAAAGF